MSTQDALNELKQKIRNCLYWHDYEDGSGETPICVCDQAHLKKLLEKT
jgi:hypothetical protein